MSALIEIAVGFFAVITGVAGILLYVVADYGRDDMHFYMRYTDLSFVYSIVSFICFVLLWAFN